MCWNPGRFVIRVTAWSKRPNAAWLGSFVLQYFFLFTAILVFGGGGHQVTSASRQFHPQKFCGCVCAVGSASVRVTRNVCPCEGAKHPGD